MAEEQDEEMKDANGTNAKHDTDGLKANGALGDEALKKKKEQKKKAADKPELSEEDLELKANLEMMVERISDSDPAVQRAALDMLNSEIRTSTTSMTSVPKPLKFLRPHYDGLKQVFERMEDTANKEQLADAISVLAITCGKEGEREALKYRLLGSSDSDKSKTFIHWGHEYLRVLAGEIGHEYQSLAELEATDSDGKNESEEASNRKAKKKQLMDLVAQIIPYYMKRNSEPEAMDLLLETDHLTWVLNDEGGEKWIDEKNYSRTCLYLLSCSHYLPEPENINVLKTAYAIYWEMNRFVEALRIAIKLRDWEWCREIVLEERDPHNRSQQAYILAQSAINLDFESIDWEGDDWKEEMNEIRDTQMAINNNEFLSEDYQSLARDLDVMEPKAPEDVYKSHLVEGRRADNPAVDSARQNMAASIVSGLVNAGHLTDKLVTQDFVENQDGTKMHWIFKNKDFGKTVAVASIGLVHLWAVDQGLAVIDKYLYSKDPLVQAGASLAIGVVCTRQSPDSDPAFALISDGADNTQQAVRLPSLLGMGIAYADSNKEELEEFHCQRLSGGAYEDLETQVMHALSLAMIYVGTGRSSIVDSLLQILMTKTELDLSNPFERFLPLALGLMFLGRGDEAETTLEVIKAFNPKIRAYCEVTVESMAYAGTGDVLMVQKMMAIAGDHIEFDEGEEWKVAHVGAAVIGLALISMGEDVGSHMVLRTIEHILQYGEPYAREAVPLALALLNTSNPDMNVMDSLSRLSHDSSQSVAMNAILGLGLIGAGTNNARLAGLLRNLSSYYYKDPQALFLVKLAQGLVHAGKGLVTLSPVHSDGFLLSACSLAGILPVLHASLALKKTIAGKHPWLFFSLATAIRPKMLMTKDTNHKMLPVSVRVGQAVDTVAQAGRPKTISGFQTHTTPVLLNAGERAELATEKYIALSSVLEGVVILKPNPDYVELAE